MPLAKANFFLPKPKGSREQQLVSGGATLIAAAKFQTDEGGGEGVGEFRKIVFGMNILPEGIF